MSPSIWQLLLVAVIILLLFGGRGKISAIMGDLAKGITSFKKGLKDEEAEAAKAKAEAQALSKGETIDVTPEKRETKN